MKINAINLQTYQNLSIEKNRAAKKAHQNITAKQTHNIEGAKFAEYLDKNEIKYLNKNFKPAGIAGADNKGSDPVDAVRRRIDILA